MGITENTKDLALYVKSIANLSADGSLVISVMILDRGRRITWDDVFNSKHLTEHHAYIGAKNRRLPLKVVLLNVADGLSYSAERFIEWGDK